MFYFCFASALPRVTCVSLHSTPVYFFRYISLPSRTTRKFFATHNLYPLPTLGAVLNVSTLANTHVRRAAPPEWNEIETFALYAVHAHIHFLHVLFFAFSSLLRRNNQIATTADADGLLKTNEARFFVSCCVFSARARAHCWTKTSRNSSKRKTDFGGARVRSLSALLNFDINTNEKVK